MYPQLSLDHEGEMEDLAKHSSYIAGFLDPSVQGRTDLYDLLVNGVCVCVCVCLGGLFGTI